MESCTDMVDYFYSVLCMLLDRYLPVVPVTTYTYMPERLECEVLQKARYINTLTFTFTFTLLINHRKLITSHQRAYLSGNTELYRKLRNKVQRTAKDLRKKYYARSIESLHEANPHNWWLRTKQFLSVRDPDPFASLSTVSDDNLPETINQFFVSVSYLACCFTAFL